MTSHFFKLLSNVSHGNPTYSIAVTVVDSAVNILLFRTRPKGQYKAEMNPFALFAGKTAVK